MKHKTGQLITLIGLAFALSQCMDPAQSVSTPFRSPGTEDVTGMLQLQTPGDGSTSFRIKLAELPPETELSATLYGGSCAQRSASFSRLASFRSDAEGNATAEGSVLFRASENISFATLTDGEHVVVVEGTGVTACAAIEKME